MKRVLMTGASGLAGSHLVEELKDDHEIIGVYKSDKQFSNLRMMGMYDDVCNVFADITDFDEMRSLVSYYDPDVVVHLAAQTILSRGFADPVSTYEANVMGTVNLLEAVRLSQSNPHTIVQTTDKIFGDQMKAEEDAEYVPTGPYAASKIGADSAAISYQRTYDMDVSITRSVNIYGYESYNKRIVSNTITQCLKGNNPIIFTNVEGVRGYIHASDFAGAMKAIMNSDPDKYNIATDTVLGQEEVVRKILEFFPDLEPRYVEKEDAEREIAHQSLKCSDFGWSPEYTFKEGIKRTIEDYKKYGSSELDNS